MTFYTYKYFYRLILLCTFLIANSAFGVNPPLTKVKLQLKWKHQFQFAGYYAAIENGYYNDFGLDVELIEADANNSPMNAISQGNADFSIITSDVVLLRDKGYDVVVLASIFQHSAMVLLSPSWSGISHVHNLAGKKVMMEDHSADLVAFMSDEGLSLNQLDVIPHAFDIKLLLDKKVDAMSAYSTTEPYILSKENISYSIITPRSGGIDFYGDVLVCSEKLVKNNPDLAIAFREASIKGWNYAMDNKEEVIDIIYEQYSQRLTKPHLIYEAKKMQGLINHDLIEIGYSNPGRWEHIINVYKRANMLSNEASINGLFYTDYIESKYEIPWRLIVIFLLILTAAVLIILFFIRLSKKLQNEIAHSKKINQELKESKEELLVSNEQLNQLSGFKEDMTNMIVHDLKTPLSAIMNIDLYMDDDNWMKIIKQSAFKMHHLIQNILDVYKYETSALDLHKKKLPLVDIITSALNEILFIAEQKEITFERNENIKCLVNVDEEIIHRVFANILSNAIKFSPEKGTINIYVKINETNQTQVVIGNQGPGISKDKQAVIFEKFGQATVKNEGVLASTGLGLTFCKMAIEAHGGKIGVISESKQGVEFYFTLPDTKCGGCTSCKTQ